MPERFGISLWIKKGSCYNVPWCRYEIFPPFGGIPHCHFFLVPLHRQEINDVSSVRAFSSFLAGFLSHVCNVCCPINCIVHNLSISNSQNYLTNFESAQDSVLHNGKYFWYQANRCEITNLYINQMKFINMLLKYHIYESLLILPDHFGRAFSFCDFYENRPKKGSVNCWLNNSNNNNNQIPACYYMTLSRKSRNFTRPSW